MLFGKMSHSALCRIRPYVVQLCVVRRIVVGPNVVLRNVFWPTASVSTCTYTAIGDPASNGARVGIFEHFIGEKNRGTLRVAAKKTLNTKLKLGTHFCYFGRNNS